LSSKVLCVLTSNPWQPDIEEQPRAGDPTP